MSNKVCISELKIGNRFIYKNDYYTVLKSDSFIKAISDDGKKEISGLCQNKLLVENVK